MRTFLAKIKNFKLKVRKSGGFTLIEMLVYMGLLSIFLMTLTDIFVSILNTKAESEATSAVEQDGRYILSKLNYDIARASSVTNPAVFGESGNTLSIVISGVANTYSLNGGNLQLIDNLGTVYLNSSETSLSSLAVQKLGNSGGKDTVRINFTINSQTQRNSGAESRTFQTTIGRRE